MQLHIDWTNKKSEDGFTEVTLQWTKGTLNWEEHMVTSAIDFKLNHYGKSQTLERLLKNTWPITAYLYAWVYLQK